MSDFYRQQSDYWFARSCRYAELVGAVDAYTDAGISGDIITAGQALARIRHLLDDLKADNIAAQQIGGGRP